MIEPISPSQRAALDTLARLIDSKTYLAGGVAVALRLRHRRSHDLDLFAPASDPQELVERLGDAPVRVISRAEGTLYLEVDGVPTSVIRYRYPLLAPAEQLPGVPIPVASADDLVCMKLSAIASRGAARDFWDLDELLRAHATTLEGAIALYAKKYAAEDVGHVVRSLAYFDDADAAPLPDGLADDRWAAIKAEMRSRVLLLG